MSEDVITIAGAHLSADISLLGAELQALRDEEGRDLLWSGDAAYWAGRAPVLFPIVGSLNGGRYSLDGKSYELPRHGFARRRTFSLLRADDAQAVFRLSSDDETRAVYPFEFTLDLGFAISGHQLDVEAELTNTGTAPLPASLGFHPAFVWPLPYGGTRAEHRLVFANDSDLPLHRLDADGLLDPAAQPSPLDGDTLVLDDSLFTEDALVFTALKGSSLSYGVPGRPHLDVHYPDTPHLGIWSKPGAGFVCIEPWQGHSDPAGFAGDIWDKPGIVRLEPGARRNWRMSVELLA